MASIAVGGGPVGAVGRNGSAVNSQGAGWIRVSMVLYCHYRDSVW